MATKINVESMGKSKNCYAEYEKELTHVFNHKNNHTNIIPCWFKYPKEVKKS